MGQLVTPKTFLIGQTVMDPIGMKEYLKATDNEDFLETIRKAKEESGLSEAEVLVSFYAKLCYRSLTLGKNANLQRVRDVEDNLVATFAQGHGSVWEHVWINFVTTGCSRVMTHELCRNRAGVALSQTSGRYCRLDKIDLIAGPDLAECHDLLWQILQQIEDTVYLLECRVGLRKPPGFYPHAQPGDCLAMRDHHSDWEAHKWVPNDDLPFARKKALTSAIRRIAPNGQANEIGWSCNIRALRHLIMLRTSPHAEWEIRLVMNQVYEIVKSKWPLMFYGAKEYVVDGLLAITGLKTQPYEVSTDYLAEAPL